jgi:hypothetical protein
MIKFIKFAFRTIDTSKDISTKLKYLFYSVFYALLAVLLFIILGRLFYDSINYLFNTHLNITDISEATKNNLTLPFYVIVILGPFVEEILFRLWLSFKKIEVIISFIFWLFILINGSYEELNLSKNEWLTFVFLSLAYLWGVDRLFKKNPTFLAKYKYHFYILSLVTFTLVHAMNFDFFTLHLLILSPLYLFPKMIIGFFMTRLRISFGFIWGLFFHIIINGISFVLSV